MACGPPSEFREAITTVSVAGDRIEHMFDDTGDDGLDATPLAADPPTAETLGELAPGAGLATLLDGLDATVERLDDHLLVEVVAAWRRVASWAAAGAARAAAELAGRDSMNPIWPASAGTVGQPCVAADELALRLGMSRAAAQRLVRRGRAFDQGLWPTGDALRSGAIDEARADVLVHALDAEPWQVALAVQARVLPRASHRTRTQLARDVHRALLEVDPAEADRRAATAVAGRQVRRPTVLPDGMAGIWAVLPAPTAMATWGRLDGVARAARTDGDGRTLDQLRADALAGLVLGGVHDDGRRGTGRHGDDLLRRASRVAVRADVHVTVALDHLLPTAGAPLPPDHGQPAGDADSPVDLVGPPAPVLAGYGPIAPATAAALAHGGTWRRLVTDPLSGAVLDVGTTRYRPPPALDRHVRLRDGTCRRPGCTTVADHCDLDHTVPHGDAGGRTSHDNLGALCRRDHVLKTHAGFRLVQEAPGTFAWTTPTGHRYRQEAEPVGAHLPADPDLTEELHALAGDRPRDERPIGAPPPGGGRLPPQADEPPPF